MEEDTFLNIPQILNIRTENSIHEELLKKIEVSSKASAFDIKNQSDDAQKKAKLDGDSLSEETICQGRSPKSESNGSFNPTTGLLDLEKYLKRQAEVAAKRKQNATKNPLKSAQPKKKEKTIERVDCLKVDISRKRKRSPINSKNGRRKTVKNHKNDDVLIKTSDESNNSTLDISSEQEDFQESDNGSEYVPSSSDESVSQRRLRRVSKRKKKLKKCYDDGDENQYRIRLSKLTENDTNPPESSLRTISNLFKLPKSLWRSLYPYQRVSVDWLWELHNRNLGGLLGDEMGLGKTVQIIAFLAGLDTSQLLSDGGRFRGLGPTLIICPATLLEQWVDHFHKWYPSLRIATLHQSGSYQGSPSTLLESLKVGGVLLISYSGFLINSDLIIPFKWHYVILDEGHKIRNPTAKITKLVKKVCTPHRLLLTGSPMQNSLKELWSLFDFILPGKLGTLDAFMEHCAGPITRGGYTNASTLQEVTALQIATMLKEAITPYMLRRTKTDVQHVLTLPEKNEQVLLCCLTQEQTDLYKEYLTTETIKSIIHERSSTDGKQRARMLVAVTALRKICNHPHLYTYSNNEALNENSESEEENVDNENYVIEKFGYWKMSGKMIVVRSLLKIWKKQGHRALIFTQGRQMLHILESLIQRENYKYLRLDGTTPMSERQKSIKLFNLDESYFIFVSTTRVGGLGTNLTGANRVIIYDPDWNPATDTQARERVWRIGQNKSVTIYRLISAGTIEEKIYHRQIFKLLLSNKVLDDPRQRRLFQTSDLSELFHLNEPIDGNLTESDKLFKNSIVRKNLNNCNKSEKKSKKISALFEGERVSNLIGRRLGKSTEEKEPGIIDDDNYVLNKLFAKSGVNSAITHDTVLSTAKLQGHMTTPMHRLAQETAQENMDFIRQSRKWCWKPSWNS